MANAIQLKFQVLLPEEVAGERGGGREAALQEGYWGEEEFWENLTVDRGVMELEAGALEVKVKSDQEKEITGLDCEKRVLDERMFHSH